MIEDTEMAVGLLHIRLVIRGAHSLKEKRRVVKSLKDRIRSKFNASVAEVGSLDVHQVAALGVAVVANDRTYINSVLSQIGNLARGARGAEVAACDMEIL